MKRALIFSGCALVALILLLAPWPLPVWFTIQTDVAAVPRGKWGHREHGDVSHVSWFFVRPPAVARRIHPRESALIRGFTSLSVNSVTSHNLSERRSTYED